MMVEVPDHWAASTNQKPRVSGEALTKSAKTADFSNAIVHKSFLVASFLDSRLDLALGATPTPGGEATFLTVIPITPAIPGKMAFFHV
jgi:hypothetical protein